MPGFLSEAAMPGSPKPRRLERKPRRQHRRKLFGERFTFDRDLGQGPASRMRCCGKVKAKSLKANTVSGIIRRKVLGGGTGEASAITCARVCCQNS